MKIVNKKAAMFGLDARIALAIFGALSVISGAALYSAIQQAKVVQWQTYFSELNKASEAYYLDTGRQIPLTANTSYDTESLFLSIVDLAYNQDSVAGWQGPYWQTTYYNTSASADYDVRDSMIETFGNVETSLQLWLRQTSTWASGIDSAPFTNELCALNSTDCAEWLVVYAGTGGTSQALNMFNLLDESLDAGDGAYSGNVRYSTYGPDYLLVKGRPRVYR